MISPFSAPRRHSYLAQSWPLSSESLLALVDDVDGVAQSEQAKGNRNPKFNVNFEVRAINRFTPNLCCLFGPKKLKH